MISRNAHTHTYAYYVIVSFCVQVGGVSYTASGVYVEEFRRRWNKSFRWAQDGQHSVVREVWQVISTFLQRYCYAWFHKWASL